MIGQYLSNKNEKTTVSILQNILKLNKTQGPSTMRTKQITVLKADLPYPNDVAVSSDRMHVVVAHMVPCQAFRYWLKGPKTGQYEVLVDMPGYPAGQWPGLVGKNFQNFPSHRIFSRMHGALNINKNKN